MKIVIIGYGTAGMTAAGYARITNRKAEIVVFEKRPYAIYHPCSMPDVIARVLPSWDLVKEEAPRMPRFKVHTSTVVEEVDLDGKKVVARNLKTGEKITEEFDKLILATGSVPYVPRAIKIADPSGVYVLKVVEDGVAIDEAASKYKSAVVVGGSALGIEVAHALRLRGLDVTLIEYCPSLMPGKLDPELAEEAKRKLEEEGVKVVLGKGVSLVEGPEGAKKVHAGDEVFEAGFVVMATGVRPEVTLAKQMGLEIGRTGGIKVDEHMRTSHPDVYAGGDNAEVKDLVTGEPTLSLFASTALHMGRVAGINAAGGSATFKGVLNVWIVNLHGFMFGGVGCTEEMAKKKGLKVISVAASAREQPEGYPEAKEVTVKLVVDAETRRVLGGQAVGYGRVKEYLNLLSLLIAKQGTVDDLLEMEAAYTPSVCDIIHPLHAVANAAIRRLR